MGNSNLILSLYIAFLKIDKKRVFLKEDLVRWIKEH